MGEAELVRLDSANVLICILGNARPFIPRAEQFSEQEDEKLIKRSKLRVEEAVKTQIF